MKGDLNMNKRELIETVASNAQITKKEADAVVNATLDAIIDGLAKEGKVIIPGFGSFEVRNKTAREGRNPRTGEKVKIAAKRAPAFKPGKAMKDAVEKK
jgi:DNA-binding protein HU-beta